MKDQSKVQVAIVGAGAIASVVHIPVWKQISTSRLIGIYDISREKSESIAKQNKIPRVYESLEDLVKDDAIDLVDICTPIHTHIPVIETALKAGKHVITEKPLSPRSDEAIRVVKLSERMNLALAVSQNHLYSNAIRQLKSRIVEGHIGELLLLNITYPVSIYKPDHWTANPSTGGLLFELGIHPSYIAIFLFGKADTVRAFGNEPSPNRRVGFASIVLENRQGICNIILSPVEDQPTIRAFGTEGYVTVNLFADAVLYNKERMRQEYGSSAMHPMMATGMREVKDWLTYSGEIAKAYLKRGVKFFMYGHRTLNQFTFFNEVLSQIMTGDNALQKQNKQYLDVAIESIQLLEKIRECLKHNSQQIQG